MFSHASMNRSYALVWNDRQQAYVPAPETARRSGKRSRTVLAAAVAALCASGAASALEGGALPGGGKVVAGQATIGQTGNAMTINQDTAKAVIDWQRFNIGRDASVEFKQPSSSAIALNRVVGQDPTRIFGRLGANGQVFIVNPNGVLFGAGSQVSAAAVLASTRNISNADFLSGELRFQGDSGASVVNDGSIRALEGGYVALVGAQVINSGTLHAGGGDVRLAAADQVLLKVDGAGLASFAVERGTLDALAANHGLIEADGGRVYLTAGARDALARSVVNNDGVIEARTAQNRGGTIVLLGDMAHGSVQVGGTLDVSAPNGGDGGFIETSAASVKSAAGMTVKAGAASGKGGKGGKNGNWLIDPVDFTIAASGGDISGAQLATALGSTNVRIDSVAGAGGVNGDVNVNDVVSWNANALTLSAQNNINVNANLDGSGSASLALEVGQGAPASGNASAWRIADGVRVNLPGGNNLSLKQGSDGAITPYYVITSLGADGSLTGTDLQGIRGNLAGNYALGADIDASPTAAPGWRGGMGFHNLGSNGDAFTGNFEGLGHSIDSLTQNTVVGYIGLIGELALWSRVANLHLTNASIQGGLMNVGAVVSRNYGTVEDVTVQGAVAGDQYVGGVVGTNYGTVRNARVDAAVAGTQYYIGGVAGKNEGAVIASSSNGSVTGSNNVGGLIGWNTAPVSGLSSSSSVNASSELGGLIGRSDAAVADSFASGVVTGGEDAGGLIGHALDTVVNSHASGDVSGNYNVGGLIGEAGGDVTGVYATGAVSGTNALGGLIGKLTNENRELTVRDAYASGSVTGSSFDVGGLIGTVSRGIVENSHASGNVSGRDSVGGLIGTWFAQVGNVSTSYAEGTASGRNNVGGLIGQVSLMCQTCTVNDSHATGDVSSTGSYGGGLIGYDLVSSLERTYATGEVTGNYFVGGLSGTAVNVADSYANGAVYGRNGVGGLVGQEKMGGTITRSHATGNVNNTGSGSGFGGLVGANGGTITGGSYALGAVTGDSMTGGLVGSNENGSRIDDARTGNAGLAGGLVSGNTRTGGLVGYNNRGTVVNASASGNVIGNSSSTGGLVGYNRSSSSVSASLASGSVTGADYTGGVIGENGGSLDSSDYLGSGVSGRNSVGGLVGYHYGSIGANAASGGIVIGSGNGVGGLVGSNSGNIGAGATSSAQVQGNDQVGGLVGWNGAVLAGVSAIGGSVQGRSQVGGLVGSQAGASITNSIASVAVNGADAVGGFAGNIDSGAVLTSNAASGNVAGASNVGGFVGTNATALSGNSVDGNRALGTVNVSAGPAGGFAGANSGAIDEVTSTNSVDGGANAASGIGGIIGENSGSLFNSHAANTVSAAGSDAVGGAVGRNTAAAGVLATYATNAVSGRDAVGGLVGDNSGAILGSYSAGTVQGRAGVGGLVGQQSGATDNAYSTASVAGVDEVGGLVGRAGGSIDHTYASGGVSGSGVQVGGLVGSSNGVLAVNSYYSLDGTGQAHSSGDYAGSGEVADGKTGAELRSAATFVGWDLSSTGSNDRIWRSYDGLAAPLLTWWLTPLTITANGPGASYVYNGQGHTDLATGLTYTETLAPGHLLGAAAYATGKDVGVYTAIGGNYSDQQGYDIAYVNNGSLTITPAALSAALAEVTKVYDGNANAAGAGVLLNGFVAGEGASASLGGGAFNSKNVLEATTVSGTLGPLVANEGTLLSNYILPSGTVSGNGRITPKTVDVGATAAGKVYDGSRTAQVTIGALGFIEGDQVDVNGSGLFADKNAGSGKTVDVVLALGGADAANYAVPAGSVTALADIAPKAILVRTGVADKIYDGTAGATVSVSGEGVVAGDSVQFDASGSFADKNVGSAIPVALSVAARGTDAANYSFAAPGTASASILARPLTIGLQGLVAKASDDSLEAALTSANYAVGNLVSGETVQVNATRGSYDSASAGRNKTVTVQLGAGDYSAGANTLLSNYVLPSGPVSGDVGLIAGTELPLEVVGALASLPTHAAAIEGRSSLAAVATAGGLARVSPADGAIADPLAPAPASALSGLTRENLALRRAFSIGDGGMRLPRGVQGSDKDAAQ